MTSRSRPRWSRIEETSAFRFVKRRGEAVIVCLVGRHHHGRSSGGRTVVDLLNLETGFFPFEIRSGGGTQTVLYHRAHVITSSLPENEAPRDAATRSPSAATSGSCCRTAAASRRRPGLPARGRDRLSDWARQPETFRYVETDEGHVLVNVAHIVAVTEEPLA